MPFRFLPLPRPQRLPSPCLRLRVPSPQSIASRPFHASACRKTDKTLPNHYETLQLPPSASSTEIKRQFFALSKLHHPDKNPSDPTASTRFVAISEAYHVLSSPTKKASYDRDYHTYLSPHSARHAAHQHAGSFSSAGYAGSRPPSGLSRRRTQFRGPPPSFYKSGGYGAQGAKRSAQAQARAAEPDVGDGSTVYPGGFSPGQSPTHHGTAVPHFDSRGHRRTHEGVSQHFRRKAERAGAHFADDLAGSSGSMLFNFVLVGSAVMIIMLSAYWFKVDEGMVVEKKAKGRTKEKEG